jgi:hypothetical protein
VTLPRLHGRRPDPHQHDQLARWLHDWSLFTVLSDEASTVDLSVPRLALDDRSECSDVATGDIRLLHPTIEPLAVRYVAVLDNQGNDRWLVVPFGPLFDPATPDEVHTGRKTPALRVLCPWNRFAMTRSMLQRCWPVDRLTDEETEWLRTAPPADRIGPPLRHPLDPRWDYLEKESEFRQRVSNVGRKQVSYDITQSELRMAAEDSTPYGSEANETAGKDENDDV